MKLCMFIDFCILKKIAMNIVKTLIHIDTFRKCINIITITIECSSVCNLEATFSYDDGFSLDVRLKELCFVKKQK